MFKHLLIPVTVVVVAGPVAAATIVDPDATGANTVFASGSTGFRVDLSSTGDLDGGDLSIGFSGFDGALEVNADPGVTALQNVDDLQIARDSAGSDGLLRLRGNGTPGSVTLDVSDDFRLGANADSRLEILSGAQARLLTPPETRTGQMIIGSFADFREGQGDTSVLVDGAGSRLEVNGRISLGFTNEAGSDSMTISNGAQVITREPDDIADRVVATLDPFEAVTGVFAMTGDFDGDAPATDFLTVTGAGSELVVSSGLFTASGDQRIVISDGGTLRQQEFGDIDAVVAARPENFDAGSFGLSIQSNSGDSEVLITGSGSRIDMTRDIRIGAGSVFREFEDGDFDRPVFAPSDGTIEVAEGGLLRTARDIAVSDADGEGFGSLVVRDGGRIEARSLAVNGGGVLSGDGGVIDADVILNGGTIAPGASPGRMDIDGDLEVFDGLLSFEIGGRETGLYDQLFVSGDLLAPDGLAIEISFIDGFTPGTDDAFDLLSVSGSAAILSMPERIALTVDGLDDPSGFRFDVSGGGLSFVGPDAGGGTTPIPLPAGAGLLVGAVALLGALRRRG